MSVQSTLNSFMSNIGKGLDYDHEYGCQCVDLIQFWAKALGKRPFTGNANNIPYENHDQWKWVPNTPSAVPTPGSVMCFAANNRAVGTGPYGHVDIFVSGDVNSFTALDQNWAGIQKVEEVHHRNYEGILGWLQPIEPAQALAPHNVRVEAIHPTNVRQAPTTASAVAGSGLLQPGNVFTATGLVSGQDINQNGVHSNKWWHSALGHYVWAGNCKQIS